MRVALVQHAFHSNTAGIVLGLRSRGHQVLPIANITISGGSAEPFLDEPPTIVPYTARSLARFGRKGAYQRGTPESSRLVGELRRFGPDVVIARDVRRTSLIAFAVAKALGARPVLWLMKPKLKFGPPRLRPLAHRLLPRTRFHSGYAGDFGEDVRLTRGTGTSRFLGLPLPWDEAQMPEAPPLRSPGRVRVLVVSSFSNPTKRLHWVTEAMHRAGLGDTVEVTIVGHGDIGSVQATLVREAEQRYGLRAARFVVDATPDRVRTEMRRHDLLLHPSEKEQWGSVIPEAMSQGLTVLCSDRCGAAACFEDGESGVLFRSDSLEHFTEQLAWVVSDADRRRRIGSGALERARDNLIPAVWAERFEVLLSA